MTFLYVGAFDDLSIKILNEILESNKGIDKLILIKLRSISLDLISFDDIISYNYENLILADHRAERSRRRCGS